METDRTKNEMINNQFYNELGDDWYTCNDDPIALLRMESKLKNPWVQKMIEQKFNDNPVTALDIGCGAGFLTNYLAGLGHQVYGLDGSESSIQVAKKHDLTRSVKYVVGDAYKLPFLDQTFDVVSAMDFLEHVEEPEKVIAEAGRLLKPGGIFIFHTFNRTLLSWFFAVKSLEWFFKRSHRSIHLYRLFIKPKELKKMCEDHGLETELVQGIGPKLFSIPIWKLLLTGLIDPKFQFVLTQNKQVGYLGLAAKK